MKTAPGLLACIAALVVLLPMPGQHIRAQVRDVVDDPDAYAVYASIMPARFVFGSDVTRVAVLKETRADMRCLPRFGPDWDVVVENYKTANAHVRTLQPGFSLGLPYHLISGAYLEQLHADSSEYIENELSGRRSERPPPFARFPGGKVLFLSAVGFNTTKTRALVTVQSTCGFDCSQGWHILREKVGDRWVSPAAIREECSWIS
jgi:hypothetical protein